MDDHRQDILQYNSVSVLKVLLLLQPASTNQRIEKTLITISLAR